MNDFYSFKANFTLFTTLLGHLLFCLHICFLKECFKLDGIAYFHSANLLSECDLQCYIDILMKLGRVYGIFTQHCTKSDYNTMFAYIFNIFLNTILIFRRHPV